MSTPSAMSKETWVSLVFATPMPQTYIPYATVIYPLSYATWLGVLSSLALISLTISIILYFESGKPYYYGLEASLWFTFGTLIGENLKIHKESNMALRCSISLLYFFDKLLIYQHITVLLL